METTKFCSACGRGVVDTAAICPSCGTPVNSGPTVVRQDSNKNTLSILAIVFASVSVLLFPPIFGLAALILAIIAMTKGERLRIVALVLSIVLPIVGFLLGFMLAVAMYY